MIKLTDLLKEIGDAQSKAYEWRVTAERDDAIKYEFSTEEGTLYEVSVDAESDESGDVYGISVYFKPKNTERFVSTNEGNQYRIMATVKQILQSYMDAVAQSGAMPVEFIKFVPEKEKGEQDTRRLRFYVQYIKKLLPGWDIVQTGNNKVYATNNKGFAASLSK